MSNLHLKSICLLPLMVVTSLLVFAGSGHIFTSGKLSSSLINCVAQDRYGYIWVGTEYGLNKFSDAGYDFGSYSGHITINAATFDKHGNLFVGTSESGVLVAAAGKRTFVPYTQSSDDGFNITASYAKDLMFDKDDNLWVGCYRKGLYLVNDNVPSFSSWSFSKQNYSIGSSVSSLAKGDGGTIWCTVQNSGVFQFNADGKITAHLPSPCGTSIIYRDSQGHYWVGTGNGLYSYDITTGSASKKMNYAGDGTYCIADDGHISAANRHDVPHGSVFSVTIPLGKAHLKPEEMVSGNAIVPAFSSSAPASKNYRILIVDDDREIALYINNELSYWYRFDYSPNGKDAKKKQKIYMPETN